MQSSISEYYVYLLTNPGKTTLYTGVTNNLAARLIEHWRNRDDPKTFAGKYHCNHLVYFETYHDIRDAISREKEIKAWRRSKKDELIATVNPEWIILNEKVCGKWPPL
jgi:putative endonuclease